LEALKIKLLAQPSLENLQEFGLCLKNVAAVDFLFLKRKRGGLSGGLSSGSSFSKRLPTHIRKSLSHQFSYYAQTLYWAEFGHIQGGLGAAVVGVYLVRSQSCFCLINFWVKKILFYR
jgi:hypothetical protein